MMFPIERPTIPPDERPYNMEWCDFGRHYVQREDLIAETPDLKVCDECWCGYLDSRFGELGDLYISLHEDEFSQWSGDDNSTNTRKQFCIESDDWSDFALDELNPKMSPQQEITQNKPVA